MSPSEVDRAPWVVAAARALKKNGSWTGRVHLHKHLFVTQVLRLANPPFGFLLYDYGPYSFDLDREIIELELTGRLGRWYPQPGFGPQYEPTAQGLALEASLDSASRDAIDRTAQALGARKAQELELIATCLWVEKIEQIRDDENLIPRVRQIKPKYGEVAVRSALEDTRALSDALLRPS